MQDLDGASTQALIETYQSGTRKRRRARRCITWLILGVVAAFGLGLRSIILDFTGRRAPDFRAALGDEAGRLAPRLGADLGAMSQRLYPVYAASFQSAFTRQGPEMQRLGLEEMRKLDAHAQACWPRIEAGLSDVVSNAESTAQTEMARFVTPQEAEGISVAYGAALQERLDTLMSTTLKQHVAVASEIGTNLSLLVATEPDIRSPVNMQNTLGMLLELTGVEMQGGK